MAPKTFVGRAVAQRSDTFEKTCVREGLGQVSAGADNTVWAGATEPGFDLKRAIRAQQVETGSENPIITCSSSELCFNSLPPPSARPTHLTAMRKNVFVQCQREHWDGNKYSCTRRQKDAKGICCGHCLPSIVPGAKSTACPVQNLDVVKFSQSCLKRHKPTIK